MQVTDSYDKRSFCEKENLFLRLSYTEFFQNLSSCHAIYDFLYYDDFSYEVSES